MLRYIGLQSGTTYFEHYGVKGMKWKKKKLSDYTDELKKGLKPEIYTRQAETLKKSYLGNVADTAKEAYDRSYSSHTTMVEKHEASKKADAAAKKAGKKHAGGLMTKDTTKSSSKGGTLTKKSASQKKVLEYLEKAESKPKRGGKMTKGSR